MINNLIDKKNIILCAYHKPSKIFENTILVPIQVGRSVSDIELPMEKDNTGVNISEKNISYAEMTAVYWGWKNTQSQILGLFHYRRLLDINLDSINKHKKFYEICIDEIDDYSMERSLGINDKNIDFLFNNYDIITRKKESLSDWSNYTIYEHYKNTHIIQHLDLALSYIKSKHEKYWDVAKNLYTDTEAYYTNTFIMKRDIFNIYANFIFDVLNYIEEKENIYRYDLCQFSNNARYLGFLAERLTSIFISQMIEDKAKVLECPAVILVPNKDKKWNECDTYNMSEFHNIPPKSSIIIETTNNKPIVSVIIPAYNVENYVEQAIKSVINQTLKNIEIVVINDGSTDKTGSIVQNIAFQDNRINLITQRNVGLGFSRNSGMHIACGKYIHFFDSDDVMDSDFLESMVLSAEEFNSEIVISTHKIMDKNGTFLTKACLPSTLRTDMSLNYNICPDVLLVPCHVWDKLYLRKFIKNIPFTHTFGEDIPFWWTCITKAEKVSIFRTPKINYRINPNSIQTRKSQIDFVEDAFLSTNKYIKELNKSVNNYFNLFGNLLVLHLLHKSHINILTDEQFAEHFYCFFKKIVHSTEENNIFNEKYKFFSLDKNLLYKLKNSSNFKEWFMIIKEVYSYENIPTNSKNECNLISNKTLNIFKELYFLYRQFIFIKSKKIFDFNYYSQQSGIKFTNENSALIHFILYGSCLNINPTSWFNTKRYLELYNDILYSNINPFYHYIKYGIKENRRIN